MTEPLATALAPGTLTRPDRLYDGYVFDLDGTVYLGDALLPGARECIATLRAHGRHTLFVSNNPTRDPAMYAEKLARLGIEIAPEDVMNSIVTMTAWLRANHPDAVVFVIGEAPLKRALAAAGFRLSEEAQDIDIVVASYDRTFTYRKLQIAFDALWRLRRARLVTTNPDRYCPLPDGCGEPDAAAIVAAIEACSGVSCEVNTGKPDRIMLEAALDRLGLPADRCVMVGDRLSTDIAMAQAADMDSVLVLTGETTLAMLSGAPISPSPTWVIEGLNDLIPDNRRAAKG